MLQLVQIVQIIAYNGIRYYVELQWGENYPEFGLNYQLPKKLLLG